MLGFRFGGKIPGWIQGWSEWWEDEVAEEIGWTAKGPELFPAPTVCVSQEDLRTINQGGCC